MSHVTMTNVLNGFSMNWLKPWPIDWQNCWAGSQLMDLQQSPHAEHALPGNEQISLQPLNTWIIAATTGNCDFSRWYCPAVALDMASDLRSGV